MVQKRLHAAPFLVLYLPPFPPVSKQKSAFRGAFLFLSTILSTNSHGHWIGFGWIESDEHFEPRCRRQCTEHRSHRLYRQQSNVARLFAEPAFFADSAEKAICLINEAGKLHFRIGPRILALCCQNGFVLSRDQWLDRGLPAPLLGFGVMPLVIARSLPFSRRSSML